MRHLLFLRALISLIMKPRRTRPASVRTIVVVQNMKLGDMVCTTPLFSAIKRFDTSIKVIVFGSVDPELLAGNPHIDVYKKIDPSDEVLKKAIEDFAPDVLITPGPNPRALALAALAQVPLIVVPRIQGGVSPYATRSFKILSFFVARRPHHFHHYAPREYLRLLEPLGICVEDTTKTLVQDMRAVRRAETLLPNGERYVGVAPSAGNKVKQWPAERFSAVADQLIESHGVKVVIFGGPNDSREIETMRTSMRKSDSCINLGGALSVAELKATVARCALFIASDTGPIYIAEAFKVPTVDVVGPVDEREQPPQSPRNLVVLPRDRKGPYLHVLNARVYDEHLVRAEVERTTVDDVLQAARSLL